VAAALQGNEEGGAEGRDASARGKGSGRVALHGGEAGRPEVGEGPDQQYPHGIEREGEDGGNGSGQANGPTREFGPRAEKIKVRREKERWVGPRERQEGSFVFLHKHYLNTIYF
jgi:hypothetical protein